MKDRMALAAIRIAQRLGRGGIVATIVVDSGLRYLSTSLFPDPEP